MAISLYAVTKFAYYNSGVYSVLLYDTLEQLKQLEHLKGNHP